MLLSKDKSGSSVIFHICLSGIYLTNHTKQTTGNNNNKKEYSICNPSNKHCLWSQIEGSSEA